MNRYKYAVCDARTLEVLFTFNTIGPAWNAVASLINQGGYPEDYIILHGQIKMHFGWRK